MTVNRAFSVGILIFATHAVPARAPEGKTPESAQYAAISFSSPPTASFERAASPLSAHRSSERIQRRSKQGSGPFRLQGKIDFDHLL